MLTPGITEDTDDDDEEDESKLRYSIQISVLVTGDTRQLKNNKDNRSANLNLP
ncbi:MAG: hypothetical protein ACRD4J_00290 [Nitrososphaeraceae archaeon]